MLFDSKQSFNDFLEKSTLQYIKLKYRNKNNLIFEIQDKFDIKIPKTANYTKISKILRENSKDFYRDVLGLASPLEVAHLYSFYKLLTDIFWETTWVKTFSPFYTFLFNEDIEIRNKSEQRKYAAKIITEFRQLDLQEKWMEYSSAYPPPIFYGEPTAPVIHYEHLVIGPAGFLFSLYYREKEIFGNYKPALSILVDTTPTGEDIVEWRGTDAFKVFTSILKELDKKISEITSNYPVYADYLASIGFEFSYSEWRKQLHNFVKFFKNQIKEDKIPLMFYHIVQLTAMFFKDEEIVDLLNKLIAEGVLKIKSETEIGDLKITKDGIIKRPKSWLAKPALELASDIASVKGMNYEEFMELLKYVLKKGAIEYLKEVFNNDFETFKLICSGRGLHRFATLDKYLIPKERAIRLVLESYGLRTPSTSGLEERKEIYSFLKKIEEFGGMYKRLEEQELIKETIDYLRNGRTHFERILKEMLFIMISLILHYEDSISQGIKDVFVLDRPVFYIGYDIERGLDRIKERYREFLERFVTQDFDTSDDLKNKIDSYVKRGIIKFGPGDWYNLVRLSIKYADINLSNEFWNTLPSNFVNNMHTAISEVERYFTKENALKWLNTASHEGAIRELRESTESRQKALNSALKLRKVIPLLLQNLPEPVVITKKVSDAKTGVEYYEAELITGKILKIYGTRFVELQFPYYLIPIFAVEDDIFLYPILITCLTDDVF